MLLFTWQNIIRVFRFATKFLTEKIQRYKFFFLGRPIFFLTFPNVRTSMQDWLISEFDFIPLKKQIFTLYFSGLKSAISKVPAVDCTLYIWRTSQNGSRRIVQLVTPELPSLVFIDSFTCFTHYNNICL